MTRFLAKLFATLALLATVALGAARADTAVAASERLEFHSDPWLNVHHFLYQWSRADAGIGEGRQQVDVPERDTLNRLDDADRSTWLAAIAYYRENVAGLNHFDGRMLDQKVLLLRLNGDTGGAPEETIDGLSAVLVSAMPVYLEYWWDEHDATNRAWLDAVLPLLKRHEADYVHLTVRLYEAQWPEEPRRVDISAYANFRAGYTARRHTIMYSSDPGNQGLYGLEMLLHEVQHASDIAGGGRDRIRQAFADEGADVPRNFWHAMIFLMAGAFTQSVAEAEGLPPHVAYWEREGFREFQGWDDAIRRVEAQWLPAVRGDVDVSEAYSSLASSR